jgi:hypothetical protein
MVRTRRQRIEELTDKELTEGMIRILSPLGEQKLGELNNLIGILIEDLPGDTSDPAVDWHWDRLTDEQADFVDNIMSQQMPYYQIIEKLPIDRRNEITENIKLAIHSRRV